MCCDTVVQTYEEAARQAALSRVYGGIHIAIDNDDGVKLGERLGQSVVASLAWLSPERYRSKNGSVPAASTMPHAVNCSFRSHAMLQSFELQTHVGAQPLCCQAWSELSWVSML